jgi:hypothetical protein
MSEDKSCIPDGKEQNFKFVACSGARSISMAAAAHQGHIQSKDIGPVDVLTMQVGGNNAGFYNLATKCIFHAEVQDYGPEYPADGECLKAIKASRRYIDTWSGWIPGTLYADAYNTIRDVVNDHPGTKIYVIGYTYFFADSDEDTWCNDFSFVTKTEQRQKLTLELRRDINLLVTEMNNQIRLATQKFKDVGFIDIWPGFNKHRFCEKSHSAWDQYFGNQVYLWNASPEGVLLNYNGQLIVREPTQSEFSKWYNGHDLLYGKFTNDKDEVNINATQIKTQSPNQGGSPGVILRTFHPKENGHRVIAKAIMERLKNVLKTHSTPPPPPPPPTPTKSLQIVFSNYIDQISSVNHWNFYAGPYGKTIDVCNSKAVIKEEKAQDGEADSPPWPKGQWKLNLFNEDCTYQGDSSGAGSLNCTSPGNLAKRVDCKGESDKNGGKGKTFTCNTWDWIDYYHRVAYCEW